MNISCGTDIVKIERMENIKNNHFLLNKIFHVKEIIYLESQNMNLESIAGMYAAKEAFLKAMHMGINAYSLKDIIILHEENGAPYFTFQNELLKKVENITFSLSISHDGEYAISFVIATPLSP